MAVNDIFSLFFSHTVPGAVGPIGFTHHFRQTAQVTPLSGVALVTDVVVAWQDTAQPDYLDSLATSITLETIDAFQVNNPLYGFIGTVGAAGELSLGGAELCPVRSAPVVKLPTGLRGRSYRGRCYLMPPPEAYNANGVLGSGLPELIDAYFASTLVITSVDSSNEYSLTIYSATLSHDEVYLDNLVTTPVLNPKCGTQRRRQSVA